MICDIRIDDRLIHGQVCGFWIPHHNLQRIVIVDDEIIHDAQRKTALKFGCPDKCKLSIFSTDSAADKFNRKIDEGIRVMILCQSSVPLLKLYEKGYHFKEITVGNMASKPDSTRIRKTLFVSKEEKEAFIKLSEYGVKIISQMVPSEPREDIIDEIRKG